MNAHAAPRQAEPVEPGQAEPAPSGPGQAEPTPSGPGQAEPGRTVPPQTETARTETAQAELTEPVEAGRERWQRRFAGSRIRAADFSTLSGLDVEPLYGPPEGAVVPGFDRIGWPGEFPF